MTEKLDRAREAHNQYAFEVDRRASKDEIRMALRTLFNVDPVEVRTAVVRGKNKRVGRNSGRRPNWKKAIVTLKEGQSIDLFNLGV